MIDLRVALTVENTPHYFNTRRLIYKRLPILIWIISKVSRLVVFLLIAFSSAPF